MELETLLPPAVQDSDSNYTRISVLTTKGNSVANAWVTSLGRHPLARRLSDMVIRDNIGVRLGLPVRPHDPDDPGICMYKNCTKPVDDTLRHAFTCRYNAGAVKYRHDSVAKAIYNFFYPHRNTLNGKVEMEPNVTTQGGYPPLQPAAAAAAAAEGDGDEEAAHFGNQIRHRADVGISSEGTYYLLDVTVVHPTKHAKYAEKPEIKTAEAETRKMQHYTTNYQVPSAVVIPVALDTFGRLGDIASSFFGSMISSIASIRCGIDEPARRAMSQQLRASLNESISCALARGTSAATRGYQNLRFRRGMVRQQAEPAGALVPP